MKPGRHILIAFLLNLSFAIFEFFGGAVTGSTAILSDAVHDLGDAVSIGISFLLERKSRHRADELHSSGYIRYSVLGGGITTLVLIIGSIAVIANGIRRLFQPVPIDYNGMILFAVVGVLVNAVAAFFTRAGESLNQKAVNLHMMEDVLGWLVVLIGAVVMRFTDLPRIDPVLSIGVAAFILSKALPNLKTVMDIFLEKTPKSVDFPQLMAELTAVDGIEEIHHIHIRSLDGIHHCATMHIVTKADPAESKAAVRTILTRYGIVHSTLETEAENCGSIQWLAVQPHHHHHH